MLLFSHILFLLGRMAKAVPIRAYYGVHEVCYDLSLEMHFCARVPFSVRRNP